MRGCDDSLLSALLSCCDLRDRGYRVDEARHTVVVTFVSVRFRAFLSTEDAIPVDDNKWSTFLREVCIR